MQTVTPPDVELWACRYLSQKLSDVQNLTVTNRVPDDYDGRSPLIAVRDDGGNQYGGAVFERRLGVTVCYGNARQIKACRDLAARVYGLLTSRDLVLDTTTPIATVELDQCNGPYRVVTDMDVAREYVIVDYRVNGSINIF
jgi:hypothetical protein